MVFSHIVPMHSSSTLNCEIIKLGEPPVIGEHEGISYEPGLTADQARAIALEAAVSKTGINTYRRIYIYSTCM